MLKNPSSGIASVCDTCDDLSKYGEQHFHAATMLRTELSGKRGDVCGRLRVKPCEVEVKVFE